MAAPTPQFLPTQPHGTSVSPPLALVSTPVHNAASTKQTTPRRATPATCHLPPSRCTTLTRCLPPYAAPGATALRVCGRTACRSRRGRLRQAQRPRVSGRRDRRVRCLQPRPRRRTALGCSRDCSCALTWPWARRSAGDPTFKPFKFLKTQSFHW